MFCISLPMGVTGTCTYVKLRKCILVIYMLVWFMCEIYRGSEMDRYLKGRYRSKKGTSPGNVGSR